MNSDQKRHPTDTSPESAHHLREKLRAGVVTELAEISHPAMDQLLEILAEPTGLSSSGFPFLSDRAFRLFLRDVPHLYRDGHRLLSWLSCVERLVSGLKIFTEQESISLGHSFKVLRNIIGSASVAAPPDLWVLRHVLSGFHETGLTSFLLSGKSLSSSAYARDHGLNAGQLQADTDLLFCRGLLSQGESGSYHISGLPQVREAWELPTLSAEALESDWVALLVSLFSQNIATADRTKLEGLWSAKLPDSCPERQTWVPTAREVQISWLIMPFVLAFRILNWSEKMRFGDRLEKLLPAGAAFLFPLLTEAGVSDEGFRLTLYGERMLRRGPGPFGIIHAYLPYMRAHVQSLMGAAQNHWVVRGENVAASQDANSKTFMAANKALDDFCREFGFRYKVFTEHAVGCGEATRQRFALSGEKNIRYFGADLEDAAIDAAKQAQRQGKLPSNMSFIRQADIGDPSKVTEGLIAAGVDPFGSVMMVGNGFHEIRNQSNSKMIGVFRQYQESGIILIFTEESGLSDQDLLDTGWNTYHAGFRYVHTISGQGLRPANDRGNGQIYSWHKCASLGGYYLMEKFTARTRTIFPYPGERGRNPSISVTYFCVPTKIAVSLGCQ